MTKSKLNELLEAAEYLGNAAIMLEDTVSKKEFMDLDQLYNDQSLVYTRAKRVYWAIEAIFQEEEGA